MTLLVVMTWSFARLIAPVFTTSPVILSFNKIQNGDVWYWLTQIHLENVH